MARINKLKSMGAISHSDYVDKSIGKLGTPERDQYEKVLKKELKKLRNK